MVVSIHLDDYPLRLHFFGRYVNRHFCLFGPVSFVISKFLPSCRLCPLFWTSVPFGDIIEPKDRDGRIIWMEMTLLS